MKKIVMLVVVFVMLGSVFASNSFAREKKLVFAVLPRNSFLETMGRYAALIGELKKATGRRIVFKQAKDFEEHLEWLRTGKIDISFQNPAIYVMAGNAVSVVATAKKDGSDQFRGVIIVRSGRNIKTIDDLADKKIWVISKDSAGGYLSQKMKCLMEGVSLEDDANIIESPGNKVDAIIKAVMNKKADAGCIREKDLKRIGVLLKNANDIKVLTQGEWFPQWALAVKKSLPSNLKEQIEKRLLSLQKDSRALKNCKIDSFVKGDDARYDPLRQLLLTQ